MSNQSNATPGDLGEHVTFLQECMQYLGHYDGAVDGYFGPMTEAAVRQFQESVGHEQNGIVDERTWDTIEERALPYVSGQGQAAAASQEPQTADGPQFSEDGRWWWDGSEWRAVDDHEAARDGGTVQLSPDGHWQWDGTQWVPSATALGSPGRFQLDAGQPLAVGGGPQEHVGPTSSSTDEALTGFATGSAELTAEHRAVLARIAADLNTSPLILGGFVTLTGFADRRGDEAANRELGQLRAEAARDYLCQLVADEETRQQIRAYSLGEPADGPEGDIPSLRKVEITITRRSYDVGLGTRPTAPESADAHMSAAEILRLPLPHEDPTHWQPPEWFWRELPQRPADPPFITQLSRWLNRSLHTTDLARLGADMAHAFGLNRDQVRHMLNEAFEHGGEALVRALLNEAIQRVAGSPSSPPDSPTGPAVTPRPFPTPQVRSGEIPYR